MKKYLKVLYVFFGFKVLMVFLYLLWVQKILRVFLFFIKRSSPFVFSFMFFLPELDVSFFFINFYGEQGFSGFSIFFDLLFFLKMSFIVFFFFPLNIFC